MSSFQVDREKWQAMTLFAQLGNIGSEVGRASLAKEHNDVKRSEGAFLRALDLFAATIEGLTDSPARLREVTRSRENFIEEFESSEPMTISNYFDKFAYAARIEAQNK